MGRVIIIGGGASGLFCAVSAIQLNKQVILLEKNEKVGKKIYITGKGRCNLTNDVDEKEFLSNVISNPKFLFSAIYTLSPEKTKDFFIENGLGLKTERGKRVFPESDKASDVTKTLEKYCIKHGVDIRLNTIVESLIVENGIIKGVIANGKEVFGDSVVVCTGGISYPLTGSTGDGYIFAKKTGHSIVEPKPSLVGIELKNDFYKSVQGLSLKNVSLTALMGEKVLFSELGEMLFTHFGISGPIVLSCSSVINRKDLNNIDLILDLKPALTDEVLDRRLVREFETFNNKSLSNAMTMLLPKSLIYVILKVSGVKDDKNCSSITNEERKSIVNTLKNFKMKIKGLRPIEEAIVTSGGVNVKDINPKTMESKIVKGLFFAGEVLDVDCFTGGFNIQTAFSTGFLAGKNA